MAANEGMPLWCLFPNMPQSKMPTDELILRRAYSYLDFPHSEVVSRPVRPIPAHQTASSLLGPYMSGPPEEYLPVDLRFGYPRSGIKTMLAQLSMEM